MLKQRLIVIIVMLPVLVFLAMLGGLPYALFITLGIGLAAWEFWRMFYRGGYAPSAVVTIGGASLFCLQAYFPQIPLEAVLAGVSMLAAAVQLVKYEKGVANAALGLCITLAGSLYWGILGSYLIRLRMLPNGAWWLMLVLPAVWFADAGGYFIGGAFGKHHMTPRLSPKKTWEGFAGGVIFALVLTAGLGALWHTRFIEVTWQTGLILGGIIALLAPFGDLTASLFKRFFSLKDSSHLIPGHGGVIDRIDTWVWAAVVGYYFVTFLH